MHPVPEYAQLNTDQEVNYLCCIKEDTDYNIKFYRDKLIVVIRNTSIFFAFLWCQLCLLIFLVR